MEKEKFVKLISDIVTEACELKDRHTYQAGVDVSYACVFCQSDEEYQNLVQAAASIGQIINDTPTGPIYRVEEINTIAGPLEIVKIRKYDPAWPDRGDADFNADDYDRLKKEVLEKPGFKLIPRDTFEMIELMDPEFNVRVYFSNPPVSEQY